MSINTDYAQYSSFGSQNHGITQSEPQNISKSREKQLEGLQKSEITEDICKQLDQNPLYHPTYKKY